MTEVAARLWRRLNAPRDVAALVAFRVGFGLLVATSAVRFLAYGWVDTLFVRPTFHFHYWGFGWVPALGAPWIHLAFGALAVAGLLVALGLWYRAAVAAVFVLFTYLQLVDVSNYLNHYYLVSLLAGLLLVIPAHAALSVDAWRRPGLRRSTLPAWCTDLLRVQVAVVYVSAGLAKVGEDWLIHAQPLGIWLSARTSLPWIGPLLQERAAAYLASWGGFLFDTTVVAFLTWRRSRALAYAAVLVFHVATALLFPIGMFPVIMILAATVFFDPSWPRRFLRRAPPASGEAPVPPSARAWPRRLALAAGAAYVLVQVALPLRAHLYGGDVRWHEQGMRFSWRVMSREKNGSVTFRVKNPSTGREWELSAHGYLTALQEREMSVQPDLILQLAHRIAGDFERAGKGPVEVRVDALASLNGRPAALLVDPTVDLARESDGLRPKRWILPAPPSASRAPPVARLQQHRVVEP